MVNFTARRSRPELVVPARPTPRETKALSDTDDVSILRFYIISTEFFRPLRLEPAIDTAKAIKAALMEALVHYYPLAGRLRETTEGKLLVDCNEEGVVFVEADADVRLEDFGQPLLPPYPCAEELLCHVNQHTGVVGNPLAYMQVTRLKCGAFVIGFHMCHNMTDGFGAFQFIKAIADLARGKVCPNVMPVWEREHIFKARTPPRIRHDVYPGYEPFFSGSCIKTDDVMLSTPPENMVGQMFSFGPKEIAVLRKHVPVHLAQSCTKFEVLTAFMWRCRTVALGYEVGQFVRLIFPLNARGKCNLNPPIPKGYYGNAVVSPMVEASVDDLCGKPLEHVLELLQKAKLGMTEEHVRSMVDMTALLRSRRSQHLFPDRAFHVCDLTRLGEDMFDFGWAKRIGGGVPWIVTTSHHIACKNKDGEDTILVSMLLPKPAMDRLAKEISMWMSNGDKFIPSSM